MKRGWVGIKKAAEIMGYKDTRPMMKWTERKHLPAGIEPLSYITLPSGAKRFDVNEIDKFMRQFTNKADPAKIDAKVDEVMDSLRLH